MTLIPPERRRTLIAATPIIGVNVTAFMGQFSYMRTHIHAWPLIAIVMLAATLESVALFLAHESHEAMKAGDSSFALRMSSYVFALIIAGLNYSHYAGPGFRPSFLGVATGIMSASSPWLWGIYSRRIGREMLIARGLIEPRAVKFSRIRWILWFSQTFGAFRLAAWTGTQDPVIAIRDWETLCEAKRIAREAEEEAEREAMTLETASTQADAIRLALAALPESASTEEVVRYLADARPRAWTVQPSRVRQVRSAQTRAETVARRSTVRMLPGA